MKLKALIALDDNHYSDALLDFACKELDPERYMLAACFPKQLRSDAEICIQNFSNRGLDELIGDLKDDVVVKQQFEKFHRKAKEKGFDHQVYYTNKFSITNLIRIASYSDLLLCGFETYAENQEKPDSGNAIREIVKDVRSPVILIPRDYKKAKNAILSFDGKPASLHAIKQFCYTMPQWTDDNPVTVLHIDTEEHDITSCEEKILVEYLKNHCKDIAFHKVSGQPVDMLAYTLELSPQSILVMGAFTRSMLSMVLRSSTAHELIKQRKSPLFVSNL